MSGDPYEIVGVKRDATEKEIRSSFRRRAMKMHPDRGGDPAAFDLLRRAYDVLRDVDKRAIYDQTGQWFEKKAQAHPDEDLFEDIKVLVWSAITVLEPNDDVIERMRIFVRERMNQRSRDRAKLMAIVAKGEPLIQRIRHDGGESLLNSLATQRMNETKMAIKGIDKALANDARVLAFLKGYTWEMVKKIEWSHPGFVHVSTMVVHP